MSHAVSESRRMNTLASGRDLTDKQWALVAASLPADPGRPDRRGRPWSDRRTVFNGVLWILRTGAPWHALPDRYGPYQTVHRRFQHWVRAGVMELPLPRFGGLPARECVS